MHCELCVLSDYHDPGEEGSLPAASNQAGDGEGGNRNLSMDISGAPNWRRGGCEVQNDERIGGSGDRILTAACQLTCAALRSGRRGGDELLLELGDGGSRAPAASWLLRPPAAGGAARRRASSHLRPCGRCVAVATSCCSSSARRRFSARRELHTCSRRQGGAARWEESVPPAPLANFSA